MNCRGKELREEIVRLYDLEIITYSVILNGKEKLSCTGDKLTDRYYEFLCISKINEKDKRIITCGTCAGEHFLELCNLDRPKLFNPLIDNPLIDNQNIFREDIYQGNDRESGNNNKKWNSMAYELYNVLNWLSICWDTQLKGHLLDKKINLINNSNKEPSKSTIKAVNTSIGKGKETLSEMINKVAENNDIREFEFPLLNKKLEEMKEESNL